MLSGGKGSHTLTCQQMLFLMQLDFFLLWGCITDSCSSYSSPRPQGPSLQSQFQAGQSPACTGAWISHPGVLHGVLTVLSARAARDHIFLVELDRCFDQNFSNIYRMLTKTKCLSIQPSHRSDETSSIMAFLLTLAHVQTFEKLDERKEA